MLNNTSINRSFFKAVGVRKEGGVNIDKNDLSPVVQKIYAFKSLLGKKVLNIFLRFLYVLLFTFQIPSYLLYLI